MFETAIFTARPPREIPCGHSPTPTGLELKKLTPLNVATTLKVPVPSSFRTSIVHVVSPFENCGYSSIEFACGFMAAEVTATVVAATTETGVEDEGGRWRPPHPRGRPMKGSGVKG